MLNTITIHVPRNEIKNLNDAKGHTFSLTFMGVEWVAVVKRTPAGTCFVASAVVESVELSCYVQARLEQEGINFLITNETNTVIA